MGATPVGRSTTLGKEDLVIFVHIPKTAGSTFKRLLARQFPAGGMPKIGPDYQGSINQIRALTAEGKARVRCLSGHIPFGIHQYFSGKRTHYVSFVRDPVDRALSEYFFLLKQPQLMPLIGLEPGTKLSPQAFLEHQASLGMQDFQTRVLCGYNNLVEAILPPYAPMDIADPDALIREIERSFALVGTVEQFDESLLLMRELFGWRNAYYISRNVARANPKRSELKRELADEIRRLNPMDCRLHAHFRQSIDAKIQARGDGFAQELARFRRMNRLYSKGWTLYRATGLRRLGKIVSRLQSRKAQFQAS